MIALVKKNLATYLKQLVFLAIGLLILWLVTREQDLNQIWFYLRNANFLWYVPAIAAGILSHYTRALRWKILINSLGQKVRTTDVFYAVMVGYSVNLAVPRLGEITKCVAITKSYGIPLNRMAGTMVAERLFDMLTLALLLIFTIVSQSHFIMGFLNQLLLHRVAEIASHEPWLLIGLALGGLALMVVAFIALRRWLADSRPESKGARLKNQIIGFKEGIKTMYMMQNKFRFIVLTFIIWILYFLTAFLGFLAIEATQHLPIMAGVTLLAMGSLGILAPVPAGIGTFHFITIATLTMLYGIASEPATTYAYLSHIMQVFLIIATTGTIWIYRFLKTHKTAKQGV
ncbi:MAG TPA: hypothetical protein DCM62_05500 [Bacteroidales bacterium]|nr:hypothetical protein [Bacteroidales bacterium]